MDDLTAVSLFDGIGGFAEALRRAGVRTVATVEIDPAAAGVAGEHFPEAKQFGDVTEVTGDDLRAAGFDPGRGVLTAGWPCQDLSLAGLRAGLDGARSGLFWQGFRLIADLRPRWLLLENVPGLLSAVCPGRAEGRGTGQHTLDGDEDDGLTHGRGACPGGCMAAHGGAMGLVLGALAGLGYGLAYRVLDARYFGVPQRRRRVVIVGRLGDWAAPAQVLLEPEGVPGHPAPGREARPGAAGVAAVSTLSGGGRRGYRIDAEYAAGGHLIAGALTANMAGGGGGADDNTATSGHLVEVATTIRARDAKQSPDSDATQTLVAYQGHGTNVGPMGALRAGNGNTAGGVPFTAYALRADPGGTGQGHNTNYVTHALTAEGFDASEDGTGRGTPIVPVAFGHTNGIDPQASENVTPTLRNGSAGGSVMTGDDLIGGAGVSAVRRLTPV